MAFLMFSINVCVHIYDKILEKKNKSASETTPKMANL